MTHEGPSIRHDWYSQFPEGYPPAGLFNVDAMTDGQIISMGRAFDKEFYREDPNRLPAGSTEGLDALMCHLGSDLAQLAIRQPERGMPLLDRLARSDDESERRIALAVCPPLGCLDYESSCHLFFAVQDAIMTAPHGDQDDLSGSLAVIAQVLPRDMARDLDQRAYERWPDRR